LAALILLAVFSLLFSSLGGVWWGSIPLSIFPMWNWWDAFKAAAFQYVELTFHRLFASLVVV